MIFSRAVLGTKNKKIKMNWFEYWIGHCWMTGWQSIKHSFQSWGDLMTGNWKDYALMFYDDPYEECNDCFWSYLGEDETLPKEFLEDLKQMVEDVKTGKEKVIPFDVKEFHKDISNLETILNYSIQMKDYD